MNSSSSLGRIPEIPVFRPTEEEFENFAAYVDRIEAAGAHHVGLAKVIPPAGWKPRSRGYEDVKERTIVSPTIQRVNGSKGCYTQYNLERKDMSVEQFEKLTKTARYCTPAHTDMADLERKYWQNLTFQPPIYGADVSGTLYDDDVKMWNIGHLETILDIIRTDVKVKIEGVNTPYLYWGMWKSTFPWHTEDMELYSINYLHYGAAKFWYVIPPDYAKKFERLVSSYFPSSNRECPAFLRHKMSIVSPKLLHESGIPVKKVAQNEGEFMITFPNAYHAGFNTGYNCAESTNFATVRWIDYGISAKMCTCKADSVRIVMDPFVQRFKPPEEYLRYLNSQAHLMSVSTYEYSEGPMVSKRRPISRKRQSDGLRGSKSTQKAKTPKKAKAEEQADADRSDRAVSLGRAEEDVSSGLGTSKIATPTKGAVKLIEIGKEKMPVEPTVHIKSLGTWAEKLSELWRGEKPNFMAEVRFNKQQSRFEPHCCVCQHFVSRTLVDPSNGIPKSSRKLISDIYFAKDPHILQESTSSDDEGEDPVGIATEDKLLTCQDCHVTVHSSCYGAQTKALWFSWDNWKCSRCAMSAFANAICKLCCLRGGALQRANNGDWCHLVCAILCLKAKFTDFRRKQPIDLSEVQFQIKAEQPDGASQSDLTDPKVIVSPFGLCMYCNSNIGALLTCSVKGCRQAFHATCGFAAGANFERRDWPTLFSAVCTDHNAPSGVRHHSLIDNPKVGEEVFAVRDDNFILATVKRIKKEIFCVADFEDGTFSNNFYPEDVEECNCGSCRGAHLSGARVKIRWTDGQLYNGYFRRAYEATTYYVMFIGEDAEVPMSREEIRMKNESAEGVATTS